MHDKLNYSYSVESDLGYSDGVDPKQQYVFIVTAQELDVGRLFLDAGMLGNEHRQRGR